MRFKSYRHATPLNLRQLEDRDIEPAINGEEAELLRRQGDEHELVYLAGLRQAGRSVIEIPKEGLRLERSVEFTREALGRGPDVLF